MQDFDIMPQKNLYTFSIPFPNVLRNAEDLQEAENMGGLTCIKCADALKHAAEVQYLRLKFWITFLPMFFSELVVHLDNESWKLLLLQHALVGLEFLL